MAVDQVLNNIYKYHNKSLRSYYRDSLWGQQLGIDIRHVGVEYKTMHTVTLRENRPRNLLAAEVKWIYGRNEFKYHAACHLHIETKIGIQPVNINFGLQPEVFNGLAFVTLACITYDIPIVNRDAIARDSCLPHPGCRQVTQKVYPADKIVKPLVRQNVNVITAAKNLVPEGSDDEDNAFVKKRKIRIHANAVLFERNAGHAVDANLNDVEFDYDNESDMMRGGDEEDERLQALAEDDLLNDDSRDNLTDRESVVYEEPNMEVDVRQVEINDASKIQAGSPIAHEAFVIETPENVTESLDNTCNNQEESKSNQRQLKKSKSKRTAKKSKKAKKGAKNKEQEPILEVPVEHEVTPFVKRKRHQMEEDNLVLEEVDLYESYNSKRAKKSDLSSEIVIFKGNGGMESTDKQSIGLSKLNIDT